MSAETDEHWRIETFNDNGWRVTIYRLARGGWSVQPWVRCSASFRSREKAHQWAEMTIQSALRDEARERSWQRAVDATRVITEFTP